MLIKNRVISIFTIVMISCFVITLTSSPIFSNLLSSNTLGTINGSIIDNYFNRNIAFASVDEGNVDGGEDESSGGGEFQDDTGGEFQGDGFGGGGEDESSGGGEDEGNPIADESGGTGNPVANNSMPTPTNQLGFAPLTPNDESSVIESVTSTPTLAQSTPTPTNTPTPTTETVPCDTVNQSCATTLTQLEDDKICILEDLDCEGYDDINNNSTTPNAAQTLSPDGDCLFNPDLPKCALGPDGKCPEGFGMNGDDQCIPDGGCPEGYHRVDDNETGRCISNTEGCPEGMIFYPDKKNCGYKEDICQNYPDLAECMGSPTPTATPTPTGPTQNAYCVSGGNTINSCNNTINNIIKNQITNRNTITQSGTIVVQDRTGSFVATPSCIPIERTVSLGPSTMLDNGMRVIAILSPCHLLDGTIVLNLPTNGIELVAANLADVQTVNAIVVNKQLVANIGNGQAIYSVNLNETMSGLTPNGGLPTTLNDNTNAILLWNNAGGDVNFSADNTLALNVISHR